MSLRVLLAGLAVFFLVGIWDMDARIRGCTGKGACTRVAMYPQRAQRVWLDPFCQQAHLSKHDLGPVIYWALLRTLIFGKCVFGPGICRTST